MTTDARPTTRSSSAAATTASSPPPTSARPACGRSSSSGARSPRRRRRHQRAGARRPRADAGPHGRAPPAVASSATSTCSAHGLSLVGTGRPRLRARAGRARRSSCVGDVAGRPRACASTRSRGRRRLRRLRPAGPLARRLPGRPRRATTPPDIKSPGFGDALAGLQARAGRSAASAATTHGPCCASCRWPSPTSWPRPSRPTRSRRRSPGAASATPRSGRGPAARPPLLLADSARQRRRRGRRDRLRQGRTGRPRRGARRGRCARPAARSAPAPRSCRVTTVDGRATGVALASGEEIRGPGRRVGHRSQADCSTELVDPVALGPSLRWRAGNIRTPGVVAKVNLVARRDAALPGRRRRRAAAPWPDPGGARHRSPSSVPSTPPSTAGCPRRRSLEATIPSLVDPSLVEGAPDGTQVMSVIVQYAPYALRDGTWDERREELGDRVVATLESVAPGIGGLVTARQVLTPLDLERDYGLTGGHPLHAEPTLDSLVRSGGRCSATPATGCPSRGCTWPVRAPTPVAASPAGPGATPRARSSPTGSAGPKPDPTPLARAGRGLTGGSPR